MRFEEHPLTKSRNAHWRSQIASALSYIVDFNSNDVLSLYRYTASRPEKYYSVGVFASYFEFLNQLLEVDQTTLKAFIQDGENRINIALKTLNEINGINFHDDLVPSNEYQRISFISSNILYNYQKLIEGVHHSFIWPIAHHDLRKRQKATDNMDINPCNEVVSKTDFSYLASHFDNVVRNAIAHHDFTFHEREIEFRRRKDIRKINSRKFVLNFDKLLDDCNGIALALRAFCLTKVEELDKIGIAIPRQILQDEMVTNLSTDDWEILELFESQLHDQRNQLIIVGRNKCRSYDEALLYAFQTVLLAERNLHGFDRYYLNLDSAYALPCFGGFNGKILKDNRINKTEEYTAVIDDVFFFVPKPKIPKFLLRIYWFLRIVRNVWMLEFMEKFWRSKRIAEVRSVKSHANGNYLSLQACLALTGNDLSLEEELIRDNLRRLTRQATKEARREYRWFRRLKYYPLGYLRISVFDSDLRPRSMEGNGLIPELICTIEVKRLNRVKTVDIIGSKVEQRGKHRIAWNSNSSVFDRIVAE